MKGKKNLILGFLILAFFSFVGYEMFSALKEDKQSVKKDRIVKLDLDQISKIQVSYGQMNFEMKKNADQWEILTPSEDLADSEIINAWLDQVTGYEGREVLPEDGRHEIEWSKFGLDDPVGSITVFDKKNHPYKVIVSVKDTFDQKTYIQLQTPGSKPRLFVSSTGWRTLVLKTHEEFQDLSLFAWNQSRWKELSDLTWTRDQDSFILSQVQQIWQLRPKALYPDDSAKIFSFLDDLRKFKAAGFIDETEAQNVATGKPKLNIKVEFKNEKSKQAEVQTLSFYQNNQKTSTKDIYDYFVYNSLRNKWMGISSEAFDTLNPSSLDFLNFSLDFDTKEVSKLTVSGLGIFDYKNNIWVESPEMESKSSKDHAFNGAQVIKFLNELKNIESARFELKNTPLPQKIFRQIEMQTKEGVKKLVIYNQVGSSVAGEDYEDSYLVVESGKDLPFWVLKSSIEKLLLIEFYK